MARETNAKCRLCRREGIKLFLKGQRCFTPKCPLERKGAVRPGVHGAKRRRVSSDYGIQLREKQKAKTLYQVSEHQFKRYFQEAKKVRQATGEVLIQILERRLDNIVYRLGFAPNRPSARQLVSHGHILVNGKKVDIPSYQVKKDEVVSLSPTGLEVPFVQALLAQRDFVVPAWLEKKGGAGVLRKLPKREEIEANIDEQAIVEYYSR